MHIVMVSAECAPIAKAGGLGDVIQGLSHELMDRGETVEIFLPSYDVLKQEALTGLREVDAPLLVPFHDRTLECGVLRGELNGLQCVFFDPRSEHGLFRRGRIYGEPDDAERFAFFSSAVLEHLLRSQTRPDILHCHDWQTGLVPVLLLERYHALGLTDTRTCYSLHNVGYQGQVSTAILDQVRLDPLTLMGPDRLQDPQDARVANLMKGGIVYADFVNTVSPRYAWEIQNTEQGMGLQPVFQAHRHKLGGILNGIDISVWSPDVDPYLATKFSVSNLPPKAANRHLLRTQLGLEVAERPIFAIVSRLDRQKGVALMQHGIRYALSEGAQVVLLGSSLDPEIAAQFESLKAELNGSSDCRLELGYDEALAHRIYAGADMILIPSLYEPCGLTQLIAMKYGTVPIVRRVGGLADTVFDAHYSDKSFENRNGYVFDDPTEAGLEGAMSRAIALWRRFPAYFRQLRLNGMRGDYSWRRPAEQYLDVYRHLCQG